MGWGINSQIHARGSKCQLLATRSIDLRPRILKREILWAGSTWNRTHRCMLPWDLSWVIEHSGGSYQIQRRPLPLALRTNTFHISSLTGGTSRDWRLRETVGSRYFPLLGPSLLDFIRNSTSPACTGQISLSSDSEITDPSLLAHALCTHLLSPFQLKSSQAHIKALTQLTEFINFLGTR